MFPVDSSKRQIFILTKKLNMRTFAIVLIVIGILMLVIPGINFTKKEKVVDVGPIEISKKENKTERKK